MAPRAAATARTSTVRLSGIQVNIDPATPLSGRSSRREADAAATSSCQSSMCPGIVTENT